MNATKLIVVSLTWRHKANCVGYRRDRGTLYVDVIFSASASYCHVFFQTIFHSKKALERIALQRTKNCTTTSNTSFLRRRSLRATVENFSNGTSGTNNRSIIILTKETQKLSALLATSTQHVCIRRSLCHEVSQTCVGHNIKSKRKGRSPATYCQKQSV